MFRPGRRRHYGGGGGGMGLLLLGMQFMSFFNFLSQSDRFFPITLAVMALNIVAHLRPSGLHVAWPSLQKACISVKGVWLQREWKRIFTASFFHSGDYHLYYNMASFMWKAVTLERHFGSGYFLYMVAVFSIATNLVYLAIQYALAEFLNQWSSIQSCAVGFSGVIFALKVVSTHLQPNGITRVMGFFPIPMRLACWAELIIISVLFPNVSFVGHLSGILVGLAFVSGPLKSLMDVPLSIANANTGHSTWNSGGNQTSYTYRASSTGHRGATPAGPGPDNRNRRAPENAHTSYDYAARSTGYRSSGRSDGGVAAGRDSEDEDLQEAIRMSLQQDQGAHTQSHPSAPVSVMSTEEEREAVQRSLETNQTSGKKPSPPRQRPPPYNPAYLSSLSSSGSGNDIESTEDFQLPLEQGNSSVSSDSDMATLRAARLRRFGTNQLT